MSDHDSRKRDEKKVTEFRNPRDAAEESAAQVQKSSAENAPAQTAGAGAEGSAATELCTRLQAEKDELTQTLVRRQADFENYRKRVERDRIEEGRRLVARFVEDLLPILDGFVRALRAHDDPAYEEHRKGLELIYRQLWETLSKHGVERIEAAGKPFDPHFHQAIERVETDEIPDGTVLEVLQDGFLFHGRVLRPSIVRVSVNPQGNPQDTSGNNSSAARHQAD